MRVFNVYTIDIGKTVPFQKTFQFIEEFLSMNGFSQDRLLFDFCGLFKDDIEKKRNPITQMIKTYPALKSSYYEKLSDDYSGAPVQTINGTSPPIQNNYISNIPMLRKGLGGQSDAIPEINSIIKATMSKIPKPWSTYSCTIIFDNIHWFNTINPAPASQSIHIMPDGAFEFYNVGSEYGCCSYLSNCITASKIFNYGTKYNPVTMKIEVTNQDDFSRVLDDSAIREKLHSHFGNLYKKTICIPDEHELRYLLVHRTRIKKIIDHAYDNLKTMIMPSGLIYGESMKRHVKEKMDSRKAFERVFKNSGFQYTKSPVGSCFEQINKHNFSYKLSFGLTPSLKRLDGILHITGYNFEIYMVIIKQYPSSQEELEICMNDMKFIFEYWKETLDKELYSSYGSTPCWYVHSKELEFFYNFSSLNAGYDMPYPNYTNE